MKRFLAVIAFVVVISIACSTYRSAGSPSNSNGTLTVTQTSPQANNASAQEKVPCTLTMAGAPEIKGLRLGMTPDEVLALFPGSKDDPDLRAELSKPPGQFGSSSFVIRPSKYESSKEKFADVTQITLTLLDGRVSNFTVGYNGPEWPHVDKFVAKVVEGTNLPAVDQWDAYAGMDSQLKTLKCADLEIRVFAGGQGGNLNYVLIRDLEADKKLKERRAKAREKPTPS